MKWPLLNNHVCQSFNFIAGELSFAAIRPNPTKRSPEFRGTPPNPDESVTDSGEYGRVRSKLRRATVDWLWLCFISH